ncbi:2-dehydro-3-deoxygalactonokinase [Massilia arenosa]|uniref:2-dehydro-3-deoxygalactonokinase n=2 Tax=Zemynaea arenosa TaxID=2561931 RepID=A0A4Y9SLS8_9BURK|nr:2-dehydro-3-deoxygalactonokinase [Massilia arenosa]
MSEYLLGIDWGSTNRRAYLLDADGQCLRQHADGTGMLAARGRFAEALADLCRDLRVPAGTPVVMSGMVGSAQGWHEVPYLTPDVPLTDLPRQLARLAGPEAPVGIVPGYRLPASADGGVDVMRGEETQLLGALALGAAGGWFILPGTHSKWARLEGERLAQWSTYMTGELFAALGQGGTLAALMAAGAEHDAQAFDSGVAAARVGGALTHALFTVRARVVTGDLPAAQARSFVSGLLIGTEFTACALPAGTELAIIGSPALAARYQDAARHFSLRTRIIDPDRAYCAALGRFMKKESRR